MTLLTIVGLIAVAFVAGRLGAYVPLLPHKNPAAVDFKTLALPASPNKYLVAPEGFTAAKPDEIAPTFNMTADALKAKFAAALANEPKIEKLHDSADGLQVDFVQRTPTIQWPDIVTARFVPLDEGKSTIALYSHSVYGYGDGGVNKKRVQHLLVLLK
jgi:uncharacterized protein (DUF1499 family)